VEITFAALDVRLRAAIMASVNTGETDHTDPALWGAALTLEGAAYGRLTERERSALYDLDRLLTAFARMTEADVPEWHRARYVGRFLAAAY
jgi:hypothetical protein